MWFGVYSLNKDCCWQLSEVLANAAPGHPGDSAGFCSSALSQFGRFQKSGGLFCGCPYIQDGPYYFGSILESGR